MSQRARIYTLLNEVERAKHSQDKFRSYEQFKQQLSSLCGFDAGEDCNTDLYQDTLRKITEILKV